jgi:hypothetical protein
LGVGLYGAEGDLVCWLVCVGGLCWWCVWC